MREAVCVVQEWLTHMSNPGEAIVRQAIVLRVLHAAGFDIWNPAEVVPEETNGSGNRSDFLIRAGAGKFALELKGLKGNSGDLRGKPYEQVVTYAAGEGTRWAMLTNGKVWVILDRMHNPGGTFEDHEVLKLELGQEGHTFADDLAALLDAGMWRRNGFAQAVRTVADRQQRRLDEARVRREKTAVVEEVMARFRIPTFELAADAAVRMNELTEAERDVLLGGSRSGATPRRAETAGPSLLPTPADNGKRLDFVYELKGAEARAVYCPADGSWTVRAGSTALNRVLAQERSNAQGVRKRRAAMLEKGEIIVRDERLIEYVRDVRYTSASLSAMDIAGASRNGWRSWKDAQGRPAQYYRPGPEPD
ncbi:hypothetical protein GCM10010841_00680 [Deinococcus aerophilus]|uniref:DUF4357 domain-containing protein n=2 Tax=Deinococcus aerophilus TaxID=522488 RepID=A0ABQ2GH42_9DEIO|nr:hypothetical protein GCM10010841_00680 [Deinococcus aerophilus]